MNLDQRWLIRNDYPAVLAIEQGSFQFPWTEEEFRCCLRQRNYIGTVAELDHKIVGFMIYELHKSMLRILNFAVAPDVRRHGIGRQMVQRLIDKLSQQRRREIVLEVRETNVPAQMFFSNSGFRATTVLRNHYKDTCEDALLMRYLIDERNPRKVAGRVQWSHMMADRSGYEVCVRLDSGGTEVIESSVIRRPGELVTVFLE